MPKPVKPDPLSADNWPTPAQVRAARALLGWSQADLAAAAGVSPRTLKALELAPELAAAPGRPMTLQRLIDALQAAGVIFHWGNGTVGVSRRLVGPKPGQGDARRGKES